MAATFDQPESKMFNVVVVTVTPVGMGSKRHSERATVRPVTWERGCQWVRGIMTGIGRDWEESRWVDCYLELDGCPRPMSVEVRAALDNSECRSEAEAMIAGRKAALDAELVAARERVARHEQQFGAIL